MFGINSGMVAVAAVVAFGFVTVDDAAKGWAQPAQAFTRNHDGTSDSTVVQNGVLRERAAAALRALTEKQDANRAAAEPVGRSNCHDQSWPYYSNDCLVRVDGTEPAAVIRVVQIDRRAGDRVLAGQVQ